MAGDKTTTWGLRIKADTNAKEAADDVAALQAALGKSQDAVKAYSAAMRNLRGSSDEVKEAKKQLKAALDSERESVSRGQLALLKHGDAAALAKKKSKEAGDASKALGQSVKGIGGPVSDIMGRFEALKGVLRGVSGAASIAVLGFAAIAAAAAAIVVGVGNAVVAVARFVVESANLLRTQSLFREAALGSAENAKAFGHQIDDIANRVPQSRAELQGLSVDLSRLLVGTRVSGQGIVDTFNAIAQESAAMGDSAGRQIQGIIDRSKLMGRMGLGLNELQGTGVSFQDVAGQLAKNLHIGIAAAQQQLAMGRVNVNDGAKALRDVIERQFGNINARRLLDLDVLTQKFRDSLVQLTSDVDLTPLLGDVSSLFKLFGQGTVTGKAMKVLMTDFGTAVVKAFGVATPFIATFVGAFVVDMLKFEVAALRAAIFIKEKFGVDLSKSFKDTSFAAQVADGAFRAIVVSLGVMAIAAGAVATPFLIISAAIDAVSAKIKELKGSFDRGDWANIGKNVVLGLLEALKGGPALVGEAAIALALAVKDKFKNALGIHSPSAVFEEYGKQTTAGYAKGVDGGSGEAGAAVANMVGPPASVKIGGGGGNTFNITIPVTVSGNANGSQVTDALASPSFKMQLQKALVEVLIGAGLAPQTPKDEQ